MIIEIRYIVKIISFCYELTLTYHLECCFSILVIHLPYFQILMVLNWLQWNVPCIFHIHIVFAIMNIIILLSVIHVQSWFKVVEHGTGVASKPLVFFSISSFIKLLSLSVLRTTSSMVPSIFDWVSKIMIDCISKVGISRQPEIVRSLFNSKPLSLQKAKCLLRQ